MKTIIAILAAFFCATIPTFSQTPENAPDKIAWAIKPLELPADNIELVNVDYRKMTATVLSKSDKGITIRKADGIEAEVAWDKLHWQTVEIIKGKKSPYKWNPTVTDPIARQLLAIDALEEQIRKNPPTTPVEIHKIGKAVEGYALHKEVLAIFLPMTPAERIAFSAKAKNMDPKLIQTRFIANPKDPELEAMANLRTFGKYRGQFMNDIEWEKFNLDWLELIPKLEIKDPMVEETVSLLDRIKELGMEAEDQTGGECGLASVHHLAKLAALQAGIKPVSKETLRAAYLEYENSPQFKGGKATTKNGPFDPELVVQVVEKVYNRRPTIQWFPESARALNTEMGKHELRNGRACLIARGDHNMIAIGFHQINGKTVWEFFDSNGAWRGGEIKRMTIASMVFSLRFD